MTKVKTQFLFYHWNIRLNWKIHLLSNKHERQWSESVFHSFDFKNTRKSAHWSVYFKEILFDVWCKVVCASCHFHWRYRKKNPRISLTFIFISENRNLWWYFYFWFVIYPCFRAMELFWDFMHKNRILIHTHGI